MRTPTVMGAGLALGLAFGACAPGSFPPERIGSETPGLVHATGSRPDLTHETLHEVVGVYCVVCHNDRMLTGDLSLEGFDLALAPQRAETAEKMITKLRAAMMPPPGMPRPAADTLTVLVEALEAVVDEAAAAAPNPGYRTFQRLNRAEYERTIRDLLGLEVDAGDYLPPDARSANFDNIADVQMLSPTLLTAYLRAADDISALAVGNPNASPVERRYALSRRDSQWDRAEGAPYGTRGGISVVHNFPADGEYVFRIWFQHTTAGGVSGGTARGEQIEISIDGERKALLDMDPWSNASDPNGVMLEALQPIFVPAGSHRVSAVFILQSDGPVEDLLAPFEWSIVDTQIGVGGYGITALPHIRDLSITGPYGVTGVSETTDSREIIFSCRPTLPAEERPCAEEIISRLATKAYRRPLTTADLEGLLAFYEAGATERGFDAGVRSVLRAILASPEFVFRLERPVGGIQPGESYRISDPALASRLSFFLWSAPADDELIELASQGRLSDPGVLEAQTRRLLADPRAEALGTRFAAQWLRLQDMDLVQPHPFWFPNFDGQLADAMRRETELFFYNIVREDRSFLELFTADYTFVNERLARHYGIPNVAGDHFRRVTYPNDQRRGLLGHGSILVLTSLANRTSPVLRGKWVMEVILGIDPPPPPPAIPDLEETAATTAAGRSLTTRERMEMHRANPTCNGCHQYMDPVGLALDNFDVTGKWRIRENGAPLDTRGNMWDGTPVSSPGDLQEALLKYRVVLVRAFTENLMAYAVGRRIEYYDMPTIRAIAREAEANDFRMSSFILGLVDSPAFQMQRPPEVTASNIP